MEKNHTEKLNTFLSLSAIAFFGYGIFMLIESFDFLSMLHSPPKDYSPTYDLVHVIYIIMEMIICFVFGFAFLFIKTLNSKSQTIFGLLVFLVVFRIILVYYLYFYTQGEVRWVPYIYKVGSEATKLFRYLFIPSQIIFGFISLWFAFKCLRLGQKSS